MNSSAVQLFQRAEQLNSSGEVTAARELLSSSSALGHLPATYTLAIAEADGIGGAQDLKSAARRFTDIADLYPRARMAHCVACASGWSDNEGWDDAITAQIKFAQGGDAGALIDLALLCLLRRHEMSEQYAQALLAGALSKGEVFAAPLLMRLHAQRGERFILSDATVKHLHRAQYLPISQLQNDTQSLEATPTPPEPLPNWEVLRNFLSVAPETWVLSKGQPLSSVVSAQGWRGIVHACVCDFVAAYAVQFLRQAEIRDPKTGAPIVHPVRKALNARMNSYHQTLTIHALERIMTACADLPWRNAERLTVLFYKTGDSYGPHADYFASGLEEDLEDVERSGERVATTLLSLHPADKGGATQFPHINVSWNGTSGDVLTFRNIKPDGTPNPLSIHQGQVVEAGWKMLASLWIREREFVI